MNIRETLKCYAKCKEDIVYKINEVGHILRQVQQDTDLYLSGFDCYAFINGSLSFEFYPDQEDGGIIVADWVYTMPWEDFTEEASLKIPVHILESEEEEVYSYFKDLLKEEEKNWLASQANEAIAALSALRYNNIDLGLLVKAVEEENNLHLYEERKRFIEKLIKEIDNGV